MAEVRHKNGRGTGNAQTGTIKVVGPGDAPADATKMSREDVAGYRGKRRQQSAEREQRG